MNKRITKPIKAPDNRIDMVECPRCEKKQAIKNFGTTICKNCGTVYGLLGSTQGTGTHRG